MAEDIIDDPDRGGYAEANRDAIYRLITGNDPNDLAEQVRLLGGTRAAAEAAGVTQRTVQRWITKTGTQRIARPGAEAAGRVTEAAAQARSTREGRQRIATSRRATLLRNNGAVMRGTAKAGIVTAGGSRLYNKLRTFNHAVGSDTMTVTFDAFIEGGEDAAFGAFNQSFSDGYGGDSGFFDEFLFTDMTGLGFTPDLGSD
jgi:hypothetical protein